MKKRVLVFLCAALLMLSAGTLTGCGKDTSAVSCLDIVKACSETADDGTFDIWTSYGETLYEESFDTMYGVQYDMLADGAVLYTEKGGKADEISIMRLSDSNDVSLAKEKLQQRIEERRKVFAGYKPEEIAKLDNASVIVQGDYAALIIAEDTQKFETEIRRVISEGGN
ncbi:MAG: DUF4358 domain-containing protein [Emergencia sp.]|nr:DUF4358 domain-containing protein [Emergencia sp.]